MEEVLIQLLKAVLEGATSWLVNEALDEANNIDADTPVTWGHIVSGQCWYYYTNANGVKSEEYADFSFSDSINDGYMLISGGHFKAMAHLKENPSGSTPSVSTNSSNGSVTFSGSGYYYLSLTVDGLTTEEQTHNSVHISGNTSINPPTYVSGRVPTFYSPTARMHKTIFSSSSSDSALSPDVTLDVEGDNLSFNDFRQMVIDYGNYVLESESIDETIDPDALPDWNDLLGITESETESESEIASDSGGSGSGCDCSCTTIYVNADGSLTLQNEITGDYNLTIDNNADLSLAVSAAAGAFGAGAVVIDPEANINLNAGAFGAGAFGAGAIANADVTVSGELSVDNISGEINVSEISGEVSLNASEISFGGSLEFSGDMNLNGGDINIDQSGGTITNNYYYSGIQDPSEPEQKPFTIDYDEILSEGELESILTQETYYIPELVTETEYLMEVPSLPSVPDLPAEVTQLSGLVAQESVDFISDVGLTPVYAPLAIFSIVCFLLRGAG
ncbi:MAG: hypothetical protein IJ642_06050 [Oscillospiraceae bacterium]|nr:hypothetical protein [Oscillospiraceae bacterium]MBR1528844.1 hypothetical protein [Oscillospiraceae bacterium]